jgi:hypothetical protein
MRALPRYRVGPGHALRWHQDGYRSNALTGIAPPALASFSDQDLLTELQRRLAERWTDTAPDGQ